MTGGVPLMDLHNLSPWLDQFRAGLLQTFGPELVFLGIQGSYARGEATPRSDIDVVVILEQLTKEAAGRYRALLDTLPRREQVCGFVSSPGGPLQLGLRRPVPVLL